MTTVEAAILLPKITVNPIHDDGDDKVVGCVLVSLKAMMMREAMVCWQRERIMMMTTTTV